VNKPIDKLLKAEIRMRVIHFGKCFSISGIQRRQYRIGQTAVGPDARVGQQRTIGDDGYRNPGQFPDPVYQYAQPAVQRGFAGTADGDEVRFQSAGDLCFQFCQDRFDGGVLFSLKRRRCVFAELAVDAVLGAGLQRENIHA
jgi:hypothetical protein